MFNLLFISSLKDGSMFYVVFEIFITNNKEIKNNSPMKNKILDAKCASFK